MKKSVWLSIIFISALFLSTGVYAGNAPEILIKMATIAPRGSFIMKAIDEIDAAIREQTNNKVGIKLYYGAVQGDESDVLRKIRLGQLHGGMFTGNGLGRIASQIRVMELPYVFRNYDEVEYVRSRLRKKMEQFLNEKGYIVLGWNEIGFAYNFSKVPITSIEIARSQKWWMWAGDPLSQAMFDAFEITPIPLSFTDVMTSLSTKLIDTASITPYGAVAYRWDTRFKYMNEYPTTNVVGATIVSKRIWNKISQKNQVKILNICQPYFDSISRHSREQDRKSVEVLKKSGIQIVTFDFEIKEDRERIQFILDTAKKARESLVGKLYSRELLDETLSLLEEYRKIHPESNVEKIR